MKKEQLANILVSATLYMVSLSWFSAGCREHDLNMQLLGGFLVCVCGLFLSKVIRKVA